MVSNLDTAVERYNEAWWGRPIVAAIPYIGGPLDALVTGRAAQIQRERFASFAKDLKESFEHVDAAKLDREFIEGEGFYDFFASTAERVVRTTDEEKRQALRNAFVNATTTEGSRGPTKDIMLRLVGDLTVDHMRLLRVAADRDALTTVHRPASSEAERAVRKDFTSWEHFRPAVTQLSDRDLRITALDLYGQGLLDDFDQGGVDQSGETYRFLINDTGRRLIWFITGNYPRTGYARAGMA